jgi:hypothetical protein
VHWFQWRLLNTKCDIMPLPPSPVWLLQYTCSIHAAVWNYKYLHTCYVLYLSHAPAAIIFVPLRSTPYGMFQFINASEIMSLFKHLVALLDGRSALLKAFTCTGLQKHRKSRTKVHASSEMRTHDRVHEWPRPTPLTAPPLELAGINIVHYRLMSSGKLYLKFDFIQNHQPSKQRQLIQSGPF